MDGTDVFDRAAALLPAGLRGEALFLPEEVKLRAEELRLRLGLGAAVELNEGSLRLRGEVGRAELDEVLERASRASLHSVLESLRQGYLTAPGGFRIGVCGSAVIKSGEPGGIRAVSSLAIRIPRETRCVTPELAARLADSSVLVLSPPGGGKTTFLRDLVRLVSDGGRRVALVDERCELAALSGGKPSFDVGRNTDVLELCPKRLATEMLLRAMNPEIIAMDELGSAADAEAVLAAANCGVRVYASVHCGGPEELGRKQIPRGVFDTAVFIERRRGRRDYRTEDCKAW